MDKQNFERIIEVLKRMSCDAEFNYDHAFYILTGSWKCWDDPIEEETLCNYKLDGTINIDTFKYLIELKYNKVKI